MRIGFDIDGVLANVFPQYTTMFIHVAGENRFLPEDINEPSDYNIHRLRGYTPEHEKHVWDTVAITDNWWFNLSPYPEVEKLAPHFEDIEHEHDLYFITARRGRRVKQQTEDWLCFHLGIGLPTVLIVRDGQKGNVARALNLDAYIEDNMDNAFDVVTTSPATKTMLLNRRYNQFDYRMRPGHALFDVWQWIDSNRVSSVAEFLRSLNVISYTEEAQVPI